MENESENIIKYKNYREQFKRLKLALSNGFNLEAMFIEYAIMEDRTESILHHAGVWDAYLKSRKGRDPNIATKIKYIEKCAENKKNVLHKYFSDNLLEEILVWKDERNRLIHALLKQEFDHNEILELAEKGDLLVKNLKTRSTNFNRKTERAKEKNK